MSSLENSLRWIPLGSDSDSARAVKEEHPEGNLAESRRVTRTRSRAEQYIKTEGKNFLSKELHNMYIVINVIMPVL